MDTLFILVLMFAAIYFLLMRPQQQRERARRELIASLEDGDEVVTGSGIHGVIVEVEDNVVWLEVAPDVELKVSRDAVAAKSESSEIAEDSDAVADDGDGSA